MGLISGRRLLPGFLAWMACTLLAVHVAQAQMFEVDVTNDVVYGKTGGEELLLDQALPRGVTTPVPALVFIHGGGWAAGSRKDFSGPMANFAKLGFACFSVEYRLAPKHLFPAQVEDCKCAVRWVRAHAEKLKVDPNRIGAVGASAGGHLSMMLGTMDKEDGLEGDGGWAEQSSKVQSVVAYFGPTNFLAEYPDASRSIVERFLGGKKGEKEAVYRQASPITYVSAGDAPTLIYHGTKDQLVPIEQAWQMAVKLDEAGVPGRVEIMIGHLHGWGGTEIVRTAEGSVKFLQETLKKK